MTLDVEHFAKVTPLMRGLTERPDEDGYSIVKDYLASLDPRDRSLRLGEVGVDSVRSSFAFLTTVFDNWI